MTPVDTPCPVCGTGRPLPADAPFCPACGRPAATGVSGVSAGLGLAPGDRRLAVGLTVAVALVMLLVLAGGVALVVVGRSARPARVAGTVPSRARPVPVRPSVVVPAPRLVPPPPRTRADAVVTPPPPTVIVPRPGDTDLAIDPLAAYAGGPLADRLTLGGLRVGLPVSAVPADALDRTDPDRWRDAAGDWCAIDAGQITEVHVCDPAVLARMPIDSRATLLALFGPSRNPYDVGDGRVMFEFPARGLHLRWDDRVDRIVELVLVRPAN